MAARDAPDDGVSKIWGLTVGRLHYTYTVSDLSSFREDYRYIYSNPGNLTRFPLLWRPREIQANMMVLDNENRNLVYLPTNENQVLTKRLVEKIWSDFVAATPPENRKDLEGGLEAWQSLVKFEPTREEVLKALRVFEKPLERDPKNQWILRAREFVQLLGQHYVPFVFYPVSDAVDYIFLRHGVDVYAPIRPDPSKLPPAAARPDYRLWEVIEFLLFGRIHFEAPIALTAFSAPPWMKTESLHIKVNLPSGLQIRGKIRGVPSTFFQHTRVLDLASKEESSLYAYLSDKDAKLILESRSRFFEDLANGMNALSRIRERFTAYEHLDPIALLKVAIPWTFKATRRFFGLLEQLRSAKNAYLPRIRIRGGMAPGMRALLALLWLVVIFSYGADLFTKMTQDTYASFLGALLVVILSVAVYSLDKPYLRAPVYAHVISTTAAFSLLPVFHAVRAGILSIPKLF